MKCKNCGAELRDGATFCHECGSAIKNDNVKSNNNPYVLVSGTDIDLEEKTPIYKMARDSLYKCIVLAIFAWVPLLPFFIGIPVITKYFEIKKMLSRFDNETNIVNVVITDRIRWTSFWAFILSLIAILMQLFFIILYLAISSLFSGFSRGFSAFF